MADKLNPEWEPEDDGPLAPDEQEFQERVSDFAEDASPETIEASFFGMLIDEVREDEAKRGRPFEDPDQDGDKPWIIKED